MNSSSIFIDIFAPVTFLVSVLASINDSQSIELIWVDKSNAPRLPNCATSLIELEYLSIKGMIPVDVNAAFFTVVPSGLMCSSVVPTPALRLDNCIISWSILRIEPYESSYTPLTF